MKWFVEEILEFENASMFFYYDVKRLQCDDSITSKDNLETMCQSCRKTFKIEGSDRGTEQDHVSGKDRGRAPKGSNIRLRGTCKIRSISHKFRGSNSHFIAMSMYDFHAVDVKVIGQWMENCLTLSIAMYLVFKDPVQFIGSRLATLGKNIEKMGFESVVQHRKRFS